MARVHWYDNDVRYQGEALGPVGTGKSLKIVVLAEDGEIYEIPAFKIGKPKPEPEPQDEE